jgi:hypothetical protein
MRITCASGRKAQDTAGFLSGEACSKDTLRRHDNDVPVSAKVLHVECQEMANSVDVHRRNKSCVMYLNARYLFRYDNSAPLLMRCPAVRNESEFSFNQFRPIICLGDGKTKSISIGRTSADIPELGQILRRIEQVCTLRPQHFSAFSDTSIVQGCPVEQAVIGCWCPPGRKHLSQSCSP